MACGKCGSTRIGVKRNRLKALLPSLPSLSLNKKNSGFKRNSNPLKKMIKPAIVLILAGFGTPLLLEGTLNGCHSLEKSDKPAFDQQFAWAICWIWHDGCPIFRREDR